MVVKGKWLSDECLDTDTILVVAIRPPQIHPPCCLCRYSNNTGTQLWPDYGPVFGDFPESSKQKMFYAFLLRHLFKQHGYVPGKNFFIIPFDWRIGIQGLEQVGTHQFYGTGFGSSQQSCNKAA